MDQIAPLSQVALGFISAAAVARPFLASTALALPYLAQLAEQQVKRKTEPRKRTNVPWKNGGWKMIHFLKRPLFSLGDMFIFGGVTRLGQGRHLKKSTCNPRYFSERSDCQKSIQICWSSHAGWWFFLSLWFLGFQLGFLFHSEYWVWWGIWRWYISDGGNL